MMEKLRELPTLPIEALNRKFYLYDVNIEITSLDISSNGAHLVAGSSNGMVLLFDLSNPYSQNGGMLIGQIRAKGMHTSLLMTVRFSQDSRFCFVGVTKGSSEMLAIDLGKLLVDWDFYQSSLNLKDFSKISMGSENCSNYDPIQLQYLQNCVTFTYSDAKLRGFDAVVSMHNQSSKTDISPTTNLYRLACGKGIKNFHVWNFEVNNMQEAQWNCIYDVATNGNTITHLEFRNYGKELLTKSAGMNIRLWDISSSDAIIAIHKLNVQSSSDGDNVITTTATLATTTSVTSVAKPNYTDIANSQDAKCLLSSGTFAYGGTYEFSLINTTAPKEANRDVLELPERQLISSSTAAATSANNTLLLISGRKLTREIQQVISTPEGKHALIICADGGVIYYQYNNQISSSDKLLPLVMANSSISGNIDDHSNNSSSIDMCPNEAMTISTTTSSSSSLIELSSLYRNKDEQQFASWILKRVGSQGHVILLRGITTNLSYDQQAGVAGGCHHSAVIEVCSLSCHYPPSLSLVSTTMSRDCSSNTVVPLPPLENNNPCSLLEWHDTGMYYINTSMHTSQQKVRKDELIRIENKQLNSVSRKTKHNNNNKLNQDNDYQGKATTTTTSVVKRVQLLPSDITSAKRKHRDEAAALSADNKKSHGSTNYLITPAVTIASSSKHNKISPPQAEEYSSSLAARLSSSQSASSPQIYILTVNNCNERTTTTSTSLAAYDDRCNTTTSTTSASSRKPRSHRNYSGANATTAANATASKSCSFAKLRALRDDDDDDEEKKIYNSLDVAPVLPPLLNLKAAPKVLRTRAITPLSINEYEDHHLMSGDCNKSTTTLNSNNSSSSSNITTYSYTSNFTNKSPHLLSYMMTTCELLLKSWMKSSQHNHKVVLDHSHYDSSKTSSYYYNFKNIVIINKSSSNCTNRSHLSVYTMQKIGHIIMEQERIKVLFALEVYRYIQKYLKALCDKFLQNQNTTTTTTNKMMIEQQQKVCQCHQTTTTSTLLLYPIILKYQLLAKEITDRQLLEIKGALMMEYNNNNCDINSNNKNTLLMCQSVNDNQQQLVQVHFAYDDFLQSAFNIQDEIKTIIQKEINI